MPRKPACVRGSRRTLDHAARLRVPGRPSAVERDELVTRTLDRLALCDRDHVAVGDLSGGQRKRASIASELLTDPDVLFLDEPTSGLDPGTAASVVHHLRRLADTGTTVVMTTHAPTDLARCDRVVILADGGRLAFEGSPAAAVEWFGVRDLGQVYEVLAAADAVTTADQFRRRHPVPEVPFVERRAPGRRAASVGLFSICGPIRAVRLMKRSLCPICFSIRAASFHSAAARRVKQSITILKLCSAAPSRQMSQWSY